MKGVKRYLLEMIVLNLNLLLNGNIFYTHKFNLRQMSQILLFAGILLTVVFV